jgi:hypothetical protein
MTNITITMRRIEIIFLLLNYTPQTTFPTIVPSAQIVAKLDAK